MGARLYDAKIGRFLSRDPLAELFPNHSSYSYAFNSPLNFNDPTGLAPETEKGDKLQGGLDYSSLRKMELIADVDEFTTQYETTYHEEYVSTKSSNPLEPTGRWVFTGTTTTTRLGTAGGDIRSKGADDGGGGSGGGGPSSGSAGGSGVTNPNIDYLYVGYESDASPARVNVDLGISDALDANISDALSQANFNVPDVTEKFNKTLKDTKDFFEKMRKFYNGLPEVFPREVKIMAMKLDFFKSQVGNNAPYDIKRPGKGYSVEDLKSETAYFGKELFDFDDFGNYNYGVAARAFGIPLQVALLGAGLNQIENGNPDWSNFKGYFDHKKDTEMIIRGYNHVFE